MTSKAGNRHSVEDRTRIKTARGHARSIDTLMAELGDMDDEQSADGSQDATKQISLTAQVDNVSRAIYAATGMTDYACVLEVYPDYAIVSLGEPPGLFRANYTMDDFGVVTVEPRYNWQPGEQQFVPYSATESMRMHSGGAVQPVKGIVADTAAKDGMLAVGGYLVMFGNPEQTDLSGEYFTQDTDYGFAGDTLETDVYFHHRMPLKTRDGDFLTVKERIGRGLLRKDEKGIFIDAVLYNREQYESVLQALGWSSGTAAHLVEYERTGKTTWIKAWPLGLDASLTPMPNEPRNAAWQIKAQTPQGQPQADGESGKSGVDEIRIVTVRRIDHA